MNKKGETGLLQPLTYLAVIFGVLVVTGVIPMNITGGSAGSSGAAGGAIQVEVTGDGSCNVDTTTLSIKNYNKYVTSTALSDGNAYWRLFSTDGSIRGDQGRFADGATKSVSPNNGILVYAGDNSTTHFVQKLAVDKVPCQGTLDLVAALAPIDYTPSLVWENANGQVNTEQDLAASNVYNFHLKLTATADRSMGNPYVAGAQNSMCFEFNTTVVDKVTFTAASAAGVPYTTSAVGTSRGVANNLTGAGFSHNCWSFPAVEDGAVLEGTLQIDTASTAPGGINTINVSLAYADYGLDSNTKAEIIGVDDNDFSTLVTNTPVFLANPIGLS